MHLSQPVSLNSYFLFYLEVDTGWLTPEETPKEYHTFLVGWFVGLVLDLVLVWFGPLLAGTCQDVLDLSISPLPRTLSAKPLGAGPIVVECVEIVSTVPDLFITSCNLSVLWTARIKC